MTASSAPITLDDSPEPSRAAGTGHVSEASDLCALLRAAGCGDQTAFAALYDATAARAYGVAFRLLHDSARAETVTQEAYVEIWRQSARFDPAWGSPMAWILALVHRGAVEQMRHAAKASSRRPELGRGTDARGGGATASGPFSPEARRLRKMSAALTLLQRAVLELAYFDGRTHTEVASVLRLSPGMAPARIREALLRLRRTRETR